MTTSPRPPGEPDLTVAEKRRALALLRRGWEEVHGSQRQRPLYLSSSLGLANAPDLTFEAFSLHFVLLHHSKRAAAPAPPEEEPPAHCPEETSSAAPCL